MYVVLRVSYYFVVLLAISLALTFGAALLGYAGWRSVIYVAIGFAGALLAGALVYYVKFRQDRKHVQTRLRM